jgi:hypothetical protein
MTQSVKAAVATGENLTGLGPDRAGRRLVGKPAIRTDRGDET